MLLKIPGSVFYFKPFYLRLFVVCLLSCIWHVMNSWPVETQLTKIEACNQWTKDGGNSSLKLEPSKTWRQMLFRFKNHDGKEESNQIKVGTESNWDTMHWNQIKSGNQCASPGLTTRIIIIFIFIALFKADFTVLLYTYTTTLQSLDWHPNMSHMKINLGPPIYSGDFC